MTQTPSTRRRHRVLPAVLVLALLAVPAGGPLAQAGRDGATARALPSLGDGEGMTVAAERRLGDRIAASIYQDPEYLDDAVLGDYLQQIWQPLLGAARERGEVPPELAERLAWELMISRDRRVNAFALPGGYMGVHTGLIAVVSSADELAAVLANPLPLNLRHVDLRAVLTKVSEQTGLRFRVPDQPYASVKTPYFYSLAAGYQAMDSLARVFSIPDFTWHQLGNGEVFAGSWADSVASKYNER